MSIYAVGLDEAIGYFDKVERKAGRDFQKTVLPIARKTLAAAVKAEAPNETSRYNGKTMRSAVNARRGRLPGEILVGPRGGKRGVWFRHITVGGARPHEIGAPKAAWGRFRGRGRVFLYNPAKGFAATGPVAHPGRSANPFVARGTERAMPAFMAASAEALFVDGTASEATTSGD